MDVLTYVHDGYHVVPIPVVDRGSVNRCGRIGCQVFRADLKFQLPRGVGFEDIASRAARGVELGNDGLESRSIGRFNPGRQCDAVGEFGLAIRERVHVDRGVRAVELKGVAALACDHGRRADHRAVAAVAGCVGYGQAIESPVQHQAGWQGSRWRGGRAGARRSGRIGPGAGDSGVPAMYAEIIVLPTPRTVANPLLLIDATLEAEETQVTLDVMFWVLPSLYLPVAVNC